MDPDELLSEGYWSRVGRDLHSYMGTPIFWIVGVLTTVVGAALTLPYNEDPTNATTAKVIVTAVGIVGGALLSLAFALTVIGTRTPFLQRNEARSAYAAQRDARRPRVTCRLARQVVEHPTIPITLINDGDPDTFKATVELEGAPSEPVDFGWADGPIRSVSLLRGEPKTFDLLCPVGASREWLVILTIRSSSDPHSERLWLRRGGLGLIEARLDDQPWPKKEDGWSQRVGELYDFLSAASQQLESAQTQSEATQIMNGLEQAFRASGVVGLSFRDQYMAVNRRLTREHSGAKTPDSKFLSAYRDVVKYWLTEVSAIKRRSERG